MDQAKRDYFENYEMHRFFYDVYSNARTGVLKVYFPDSVVKTVYFSEGNIVYASSNGEKDKLINILIKYKKLTQEQLDAALRQMDKNISLGRNLVNMGFITHKELIWAVKVQVISIIHSIIVLKQGDFLFSEGPLPDGVINLPLNTMKVIFDSIIMFQDREWIAEKIQQPDTVYKKTLLFEEGKTRLITNPDLLEVAEAIDGKRSLSELTDMTTLEDFKVFKLLYALKFLTLIEEKMPETSLPASEDIFEIQDEPDEDLELAEEAFVQLGDTSAAPAETAPEEEPTERLEQDQLPFPKKDDNSPLDREEEPTEKLDLAGDFKPEIEFSEPKERTEPREKSEDVFVEFKLQEDELSYEEESAEKELQSGNALEFESDAETEENSEKTEFQNLRGDFALTEQDIDSVIMDQDEESPEMEQETRRLERSEEQIPSESGHQASDGDATVVEQLEDSESFSEEEVINASSGGGGKWLLVSLIIISVILFAGTMYYYQFWLPQQKNTKIMSTKPIQVTKAISGEEDVTTTSINSLEKAPSTVSIKEKSELTGNEAGQSSSVNNTVVPEKNDKAKIEAKKTKEVSKAAETAGLQQKTITHAPMRTKEKNETLPAKIKSTEKKSLQPGKTNPVAVKPQLTGDKVSAQRKEAVRKNTNTVRTVKKQSQPTTESITAEKSLYDRYALNLAMAKKVFNAAGEKTVTLQLEIACKPETIEQAIHLLKGGGRLYLVPFRYGDSDCVIVCFGLYNSNQEAMTALNNLPQVFYEDNNEPFVASVSRLKRRFQ
ncbi:MAG: hypothetical protein GXO69_04085 [Acidobacteria bacterium]|nr:hypothetical protein [Acidobacteriota bacterium]